MPRLKRKAAHLTGGFSVMTSNTSRRNSVTGRIPDNNDSIQSSARKEKYAMVRNPLRAKDKSRSLFGGAARTTVGSNAKGKPSETER